MFRLLLFRKRRWFTFCHLLRKLQCFLRLPTSNQERYSLFKGFLHEWCWLWCFRNFNRWIHNFNGWNLIEAHTSFHVAYFLGFADSLNFVGVCKTRMSRWDDLRLFGFDKLFNQGFKYFWINLTYVRWVALFYFCSFKAFVDI